MKIEIVIKIVFPYLVKLLGYSVMTWSKEKLHGVVKNIIVSLSGKRCTGDYDLIKSIPCLLFSALL